MGAFDCHGIKRPNFDEFGNICVSITSLKVEVSTVNFQYFRAINVNISMNRVLMLLPRKLNLDWLDTVVCIIVRLLACL